MEENKKLIFILNQGCDDTTYGLQEFTPEEFKHFCKTIFNLNKNSHYGCMPKIYLYEASWDDFKEISAEKLKIRDSWDDDYIDLSNRFWFNDKCYTFKDKYFSYYKEYKEIKLEEEINVK